MTTYLESNISFWLLMALFTGFYFWDKNSFSYNDYEAEFKFYKLRSGKSFDIGDIFVLIMGSADILVFLIFSIPLLLILNLEAKDVENW